MTPYDDISTGMILSVGIVIVFAIVLYFTIFGMMHLQYEQYQSCKLAIGNNSWHITQKICDAYNTCGVK